MKKGKLVSSLFSLILLLMLSSCMRVEYGLNIGKGNEGNYIYYASTTEEKYLKEQGYTKERYMQEQRDMVEEMGYTEWDEIVPIDTTDINGNHYLGTQFIEKFKAKETAEQVKSMLSDYGEASYSDTNLFGKRTINVTITPYSNGLGKNPYNYNNSYRDYYEYAYVINVPGPVVETNGTIRADGCSAEWDIKPVVEGKSKYLSMSITFMDYSFYVPVAIIGAIVLAILIAVIVIFVINKNNQKAFEKGSTIKAASASQVNGAGETGIKCPDCGYGLREDDTFCVNCGIKL